MKLFPQGKKKLVYFHMRWGIILGLFIFGGGCMMNMPGHSHRGSLPPATESETLLSSQLKAHVTKLAGGIGERNTIRYQALLEASNYIGEHFRKLGLPVREESYLADGKQVANVVAELKGTHHPEEIVVVGAHYDSPPGSPGANDNASGVAALLELASLLRESKPARTIRFIAFVNEEPPWFQTKLMGSRVHAAGAGKRGEQIVAMLALETIGCYSDQPNSQHYPPPFSLFYPDTGNFIAFVGNLDSRSLLRRSIKTFRATTLFPSEGVAAPEFITGIGWSDHWSFWQEGYPALMVTDTAPFRYPHYHEPEDSPDKLDYGRMARVVAGLVRVVAQLDSGPSSARS